MRVPLHTATAAVFVGSSCLAMSSPTCHAFQGAPSSFAGVPISVRPDGVSLPEETGTRYPSPSSSTNRRLRQQLPRSPHCRRRPSASALAMHFGHSHSHSHGHEQHHSHEVAAVPPPPPATTAAGKIVRFVTRRTARIAFAAIIILGPALIRTRRIAGSDVALFAVTATGLTLVDRVRREVQNLILSAKRFKVGLDKHSTPLVDVGEMLRNESSADRVTVLGVVINLFLSLGKAVVGITCHSSALVADAGHSLSDLFSDFITLWAVQIGRLPPDDDHPYGHGKFETMGSLFLAMTLLATGVSVGASSAHKLAEIIAVQRSGGMAVGALAQKVPTAPALVMAGLSIISKEWLYRITRKVGEALNSQVVLANAWHHRSDAYSSVLALVSIGLAMTFPSLVAADAAAGILVAGMICMTGAEIFGESVKQLTDTNDEDLVERVEAVIRESDDGADVLDVKRIRARQVGSTSLVDVSIVTPDGLTATANRAIEERLRWTIMNEPGIFNAEVHSAPASGSNEKVCPLLAAETALHTLPKPPSTATVEEDVRRVLGENSAVWAVEGVTVNYRDTMLVEVDTTIRVDPESTVARTTQLAAGLKLDLESEDIIDKASIYLDLNEKTALFP